MTLVEGKVGEKFLLKDIDERKLDTRKYCQWKYSHKNSGN